jgi:hypothetical protein
MRLDVTFEADQRPEKQNQLRRIPPAEQVDHPELKAALTRYEEARAAERETRQTHVQLDQELPAAEYRDEVALADAREKGKPDPGSRNAERHQKGIAEAKRDWGARKIGLARAVEAVVSAFDQHGDDWEASLLEQRDQLREKMAAKLEEWTGLWKVLQVNTANRAVCRGSGTQSPSLFSGSFRVPRIQDGDVIQVADVLDGLRGLAAPQEPNRSAVESLELGVEPSRHPSRPARQAAGVAR